MDEQDYDVFMAMEAYGGGFVEMLAGLAFKADRENLRRIKATWPEYYEQYKAIAAEAKVREAQRIARKETL